MVLADVGVIPIVNLSAVRATSRKRLSYTPRMDEETLQSTPCRLAEGCLRRRRRGGGQMKFRCSGIGPAGWFSSIRPFA